MMLDKMTRDDLLPGMTVTTRDGAIGTVKICSIRLVDHEPIMAIDYTDDLYYGDEDTDTEHDFDIMRVALPSGAVIWERPQAEIRVFDRKLHDESTGMPQMTWPDDCDGKLVVFHPNEQLGSCDGYSIRRAWTRELTDEERKNWKGARK